MSANKNVWFRVTTSKLVKAPNKTMAIEAAKRVRTSEVTAERISAYEAQQSTGA